MFLSGVAEALSIGLDQSGAARALPLETFDRPRLQ